jgi:hypothetical protein
MTKMSENSKTDVPDVGRLEWDRVTKEKFHAVASPGFGKCQGDIVIIVNVIFGLRTSGAHFHKK